MNDIPCRVSADLRAYQNEQAKREAEAPAFDHTDDALMHDVLGNDRLAKPVQELLQFLAEYDMTVASFGADTKLACDAVVPLLRKLKQACAEEWGDL